jgi:perosamine synthetase
LTTSCTTALSLSLEVLNIKKGDHIAVSDFSWISSAHVIENIGAKPIFIDVEEETFNMCPNDLKKKISKKIKAIIFVHCLGNPSNFDKISKITKKYKIPILEDAACAMGSKINNKYIGQNSYLGCFSFHQRKIINTGEGGAIFTNNNILASKIRRKLSLGAIKKSDKTLNFYGSGYNFRLSEIQSLLGIKQLTKLNNNIKKRNLIFNYYKKNLQKYGFKAQKINKNCISNIQSCTFILPKNIKRTKFMRYLDSKKIDNSIGTYSMSNTFFYKKKYKSPQIKSKYLFNNTITFPCHENINFAYILKAINKYFIIFDKK